VFYYQAPFLPSPKIRMQKISAIVTCGNEAEHIEAVLQSLHWCDDLLVVDSYSSDGTEILAAKYTDRVVQRAYKNPADQKNWAIPQAKHEWVIILDADERVTTALQTEIESMLEKDDLPHTAYRIFRNNYFMGKRIRFSGWRHDAVVRFFKRDAGHYPEQFVHEELVTSGSLGTLKGRLDHFTFKDMAHYKEKMDRYARWSALDKDAKTGRLGFYHFRIKPAFRFFKHYILQLGILDGYAGYTISRLNAHGVHMRYTYMKINRMSSAA
jgi:glycosyltransferase involved in cell wall biosynthesis